MQSEALEDYDEDIAWEREQGIPQPDDPFIEQYFNGRDKLIAQEDKHRSGSCFHVPGRLWPRLLSLTPKSTD